jgi:hypothetical protein
MRSFRRETGSAMKTIFKPPFLVTSVCAAAMLGGCMGVAPSAAPNSGTMASSAQRVRNDGGGALVYIGGRKVVDVLTFPDGSSYGELKIMGAARGMCTDSKGNVFIAVDPATKSQSAEILEYAHGGSSPIATLSAPNHVDPIACSSDPTTGNLAVSGQDTRNFAPSIAIYANASGSPTILTSPDIGADPQLAYDAGGDLFATSGSNVGAELAQGASSFSTVTFNKTIGLVGHVQWDGKYFALQSFVPLKHNGEKLFERIFRLEISGSDGKFVSATHFLGWPERNAGQSWIAGSAIAATPYSEMVLWRYPSGGKAIKTVHTPNQSESITVSAGS